MPLNLVKKYLFKFFFRSGICLVLSLITVFSFLTDMSRFPYPERPIFFLSLCQLMVSLGFLYRVFYGHENVVCNNDNILKNTLPKGNIFKDIKYNLRSNVV